MWPIKRQSVALFTAGGMPQGPTRNGTFAMPIENAAPGSPMKPTETLQRDARTEDVAGLFTWAKLEGSKYRDFSALRDRNKADARMKIENAKVVPASETLPQPLATDSSAAPEIATPSVPFTRTELPIRAGGGFTSRMQRAPENYAGRRPVATMSAERGSKQGAGPRRVAQTAQRRAKLVNAEVSNRWVALKQAFEPENEMQGEMGGAGLATLPSIAFVSLAGGVGKTSMVASVACMLAAQGLSSLLVDTHAYGLLPLFFGARELRPGTSRSFSGGSERSPVRVMTLDHAADELHGAAALSEQIAHHTEGTSLALLDVSTGSVEVLRQVMEMSPTVLIVLKPDMASVVSLQTIDLLFELLNEGKEQPTDIHFLLNQFDDSVRLHVDVRERLKRQLGNRLLPFVVHESGMVSEALAECMTIVDYAPEAQIVEDLGLLARWISELDEPTAVELPNFRWRER